MIFFFKAETAYEMRISDWSSDVCSSDLTKSRARDFVRLALLGAPGLGEGHGPMGQQTVRNDGLFTGPALNQITLPAVDYAASVAFYKQMGLTQIVDSPDKGYSRFEAANGVTLSIHLSPSRDRKRTGLN